MAEKKKRVRATLTQVRELEAKLADQIEGTSRLVNDCDLWREKYQKLFAEYEELKAVTNESEIIRNLRDKNMTLEQSNSLMKEKLDSLDSHIKVLESVAEKRAAEIERLKSRGFWDRVFNR
jgi:DNA anti-recombination protein RmuC